MRILHLSDIHFGRHYEQYQVQGVFENRQLILSELLSVLGKMDTKIDHIIMTGDIAWHGKKQEFQEALLWFQELLKVTGLTPDNITFCPGNHDVNRKYVNFELEPNDKEFGTTIDYSGIPVDQLDECYRYGSVFHYETPLENYNWFCSQLGVTPYSFPVEGELRSSYSIGYKDVVGTGGDKVRIVSFNTALFSSLKAFPDDKNIIGLPQIIDLLQYGIIGDDNNPYTIAIFHHAERYLHPDEISEYNSRKPSLPFLREKVNLILCGHTETGGKPVLYRQDNGAYTLTAGAAYYDDRHPNTFSLINLTNLTSKATKPRVKPYINKNIHWEPMSESPDFIEPKRIRRMQKLGEMKGPGKFRLISGDQTYELPIARLEVFTLDGITGSYDNFGDPTRLLNISAHGQLYGPGVYKHDVDLAPDKRNSVEAMLERDTLLSSLKEGVKSKAGIRFEITNRNGEVLLGYDIFDVDRHGNDGKDEYDTLPFLTGLRKIEEFYDIRFKCPDGIYSDDSKTVDAILKLIENRYIVLPGSNAYFEPSTTLTSKSELDEMYRAATKENAFYFECWDDFEYNVCGKTIEASNQYVLVGPYAVDLLDVKRKSDSFLDGDIRRIKFSEKGAVQLILVSDPDKIKNIPEISRLPKGHLIKYINMNIDYNFIKERHKQ